MSSAIRIGIGGWSYEPWRETFYPADLPKKQEQHHATRAMSAIEVNATYYRSQTPATFASWAKVAPEGFVYTLKASRFCTNRKVLAEAGESVERFVGQGIVELGDKLGPILWQFMATKAFDSDDFGAFLALLPRAHAGAPLRHAVQVRHASFAVPEFVALCRAAGVAIVFADSAEYPAIADVSGDFVYARLENARAEPEAGYGPAELDRWAEAARGWARGESPAGLPYAAPDPAPVSPRETFIFAINGHKPKAPAVALALRARLGV